jgi:hypothetical protein
MLVMCALRRLQRKPKTLNAQQIKGSLFRQRSRFFHSLFPFHSTRFC